MHARASIVLANYQWKQGQQENAIETLNRAEVFFKKAVTPVPNNRKWRAELADVQLRLAEYLETTEQLKAARDKLDEGIHNWLHLLEIDTKDYPIRKNSIRSFVKFAELSELMEDHDGAYKGFYTAAQDCLLLMDSNDENRAWAWSIRVWALGQAMRHIDQSSFVNQKAQIIKTQTKLLRAVRDQRQSEIDVAINVLLQKITPKKPTRF